MAKQETEQSVITVVAAAVVEDGRLLVVSKKAAPEVFCLPGGKPEPGESPERTLLRELDEELGVVPYGLELLTEVEDVAALEGAPKRMAVYAATFDRRPEPAAELAGMRWTDGEDTPGVLLAPAVRRQVVPLLGELGLLGR
ncbi:NUDIX hydrolase [Streptomyces sp. NPDC055134]